MEKTKENPLKLSDFRAILAWYEDMGIDFTPSEHPIDWFEEGMTIDQSPITNLQQAIKPNINAKLARQQTNSSNLQSPQQSTRQNPALSLPPQANQAQTTAQTTAPLALPSIERAKELAAKCTNLDELKSALHEFDGCGLKRTAKNLVFYRGAAHAKLMIIGEAPGRDEDIVGKPFVGQAGQLLDRMLKSIHINDEQAHITNLVYWRPPGNRTPSLEETTLCRPFLDKQIELVAPEIILFLGGETAKIMYQSSTGITKLRGKWKKIPGELHKMDTLATLHPTFLLHTPIAKRLAWQDLQMIANRLETNHGS